MGLWRCIRYNVFARDLAEFEAYGKLITSSGCGVCGAQRKADRHRHEQRKAFRNGACLVAERRAWCLKIKWARSTAEEFTGEVAGGGGGLGQCLLLVVLFFTFFLTHMCEGRKPFTYLVARQHIRGLHVFFLLTLLYTYL